MVQSSYNSLISCLQQTGTGIPILTKNAQNRLKRALKAIIASSYIRVHVYGQAWAWADRQVYKRIRTKY